RFAPPQGQGGAQAPYGYAQQQQQHPQQAWGGYPSQAPGFGQPPHAPAASGGRRGLVVGLGLVGAGVVVGLGIGGLLVWRSRQNAKLSEAWTASVTGDPKGAALSLEVSSAPPQGAVASMVMHYDVPCSPRCSIPLTREDVTGGTLEVEVEIAWNGR